MVRHCAYFVIFLLATSFVFSQTRRVVKPAPKKPVITTPAYPRRTNLGIGGGVTRSVLYLARNIKSNNDATGIHTTLVYGGAKLLRASLEYTFYQPINIEPTWYNIKANTIELNMHIIARFRTKKAYFYPLFGLSYNTFSGFFTGENDYLNLASLYKKNQQVVTRWLGVNVGTGYEYYFRPGSFFLDYKMRVGRNEGSNQINIQDVCISAGLRFNIKAPSLYSIFWYKGTRSRYLLDLEDEDD